MKNKSIYILVIVTIFLTSCTSSSSLKEKRYSFKNGVNLAHWTDHLFQGRTYGDPLWFNDKDVEWIAAHGLDHIQIRISGKEISGDNGLINNLRLAVLDSAILWAEREDLGIVLVLMEFPDFPADSTTTQQERDQALIEKQASFWGSLASYFSKYENNVRFNIHGRVSALTGDIIQLNNYNQQVLEAIRQTNPDRLVYLPSLKIENLDQLKIPDDVNIAISVDYDKLDVFSVQHMGPSVVGENFPRIAFPGIVPDLSQFVEDGHWLLQYSGMELSEASVANDFQKISAWRNSLPGDIKIYLPMWGYYTGWPFNPKSVEDKQSIVTYGRVMGELCKKHDIGWAIYDYNSGMPIRVGDDPSILLDALNLNK